MNSFFLMMGSQAGGQGDTGSTIMMFAVLVLFALYMWWISRKDKKQRAEEAAMREAVKIGDEIITIGGVIGRVVAVKDDSVVIETGADRNKIRFTKTAIGTNVTANARLEQIKAEKKAADEKAKADKKKKK
ncbi:MAG: preprotein translocase subunit YajC [Clostridia bacterium]|nr:preprotein translocase subunit YajC [Clostridia bacterium]